MTLYSRSQPENDPPAVVRADTAAFLARLAATERTAVGALMRQTATRLVQEVRR